MNEDLTPAIAAIRAGDKAKAQQILKTILQSEPDNVQAWLWLSMTGLSAEQQAKCLGHVLALEPKHELAKQLLAKLKTGVGRGQEAKPSPPVKPNEQSPTLRQGLLKSGTGLPPAKMETPDTKQCPFCAETIKADAVVCRFCNRDLKSRVSLSQPPPASQFPAKQQPNKRNPFVTILAASGLFLILCVCGLVLAGTPRNDSVASRPSSAMSIPTDTSIPTATFSPTNTPIPTPTHTSRLTRTPTKSVDDLTALEMMEVAFIGGFTKGDIQSLVDKVMLLYGLELTEKNYLGVGSVLVAMRKKNGPSEMETLICIKEAHTPGVAITFPEMAAICSVALANNP